MPNQQFEERRPESHGESAIPHELTTEELFHTLQDGRRRLALCHLLDAEEPVDAEALAEQVAARERGTSPADLSTEQLQRTYLDLYQSHLPKLEELGLVSFDRSRCVVESTDMVDLLEPHLDPPSSEERTPDSATESETDTDGIGHSLGRTDVSAALVGLAWLGLLPMLAISLGSVAAAFAAIPAVVMAALVVTHRR